MGENIESEIPMSGCVKIEEEHVDFGLEEAIGILSSLSLTSVTLGNFLVVNRSDFDVIISEEPYIGLQLLLNLRTGRYLSRIWNQTVMSGNVVTAQQLTDICKNIFDRGRPCLGCPEEARDELEKQDYLISQTPIPRKISTTCRKVLGKEASASISTCTECLKMLEPSTYQVSDSPRKTSVSKRSFMSISPSTCSEDPDREERIDSGTKLESHSDVAETMFEDEEEDVKGPLGIDFVHPPKTEIEEVDELHQLMRHLWRACRAAYVKRSSRAKLPTNVT